LSSIEKKSGSPILNEDHSGNPFARPMAIDPSQVQNELALQQPTLESSPQPVRLRFTGDSAEYFKIWITNLILTVITFGIYGPWAKVRREKYFRQNTYIGQSNMDYHGDPKSILFGRIVALGLFALTATGNFSVALAIGASILIAFAAPWALRSSIKFRFHNTSYQGIRFGFDGSIGRAYAIALPLAIAAVCFAVLPNILEARQAGSSVKKYAPLIGLALLFGLLYTPAFAALWRRFALNHGRYGTVRTHTSMTIGGYIWQYLKTASLPLITILAVVVVGYSILGFAGTRSGASATSPESMGRFVWFTLFFVLLVYPLLLLTGPLLVARMQNYVWNKKTGIADQDGNTLATFTSDLKVRKYLLLQVKNFFLTSLTAGLYRPIMQLNNARARIEAISISDLSFVDEVHAQKQAGNKAFGAEAVEVFDLDFSL
jgi:uncharacterized membrane protein YjgN (DUF898 family)